MDTDRHQNMTPDTDDRWLDYLKVCDYLDVVNLMSYKQFLRCIETDEEPFLHIVRDSGYKYGMSYEEWLEISRDKYISP